MLVSLQSQKTESLLSAIDDIRRVLLPVYEGRMVGQYDWAKKAWLQGRGDVQIGLSCRFR